MIVTRVFPGHSESVDVDAVHCREVLREWYRPEAMSSVRINLISTVSGNAGGSDGTSHTLSNPVDRKILGVIRELGDVVLVGAQSVRAESYLLPRRVPLAVLTASGDLTGHGIEADVEPGRLYVLCPESSVDRVVSTLAGATAEIIVVPAVDGRVAMVDVVTALRVRGLESIVCEGGPMLAAQFIEAGLVDELCLSTSPTLGGTDLPILAPGIAGERRLTLTQLLVDESSGVYARWAFASRLHETAPLATV